MTDTTYHQWKHLPNDVKIKACVKFGVNFMVTHNLVIITSDDTYHIMDELLYYAQTLLKETT